MSARIGEIKLVEDVVTHVSASCAGVEVLTEARLTYDPINARNYAALLVRAADEAERMRLKEPEMLVSDWQRRAELASVLVQAGDLQGAYDLAEALLDEMDRAGGQGYGRHEQIRSLIGVPVDTRRREK